MFDVWWCLKQDHLQWKKLVIKKKKINTQSMSMTLIQEKNQYAIHAYDTGSKKKKKSMPVTVLILSY